MSNQNSPLFAYQSIDECLFDCRKEQQREFKMYKEVRTYVRALGNYRHLFPSHYMIWVQGGPKNWTIFRCL